MRPLRPTRSWQTIAAWGARAMALPIQIILIRQLAGYLGIPLFLVDPKGDLLFYNEPAEVILGRRFEETGAMPAKIWSSIFTPVDEQGQPIPPENLPLMMALATQRPASQALLHPRDGRRAPAHRRRIHPDHRAAGRVSWAPLPFSGRSRNARDPARHPRFRTGTGARHRPLRRQYPERRGARRRRDGAGSRRRHRHPPAGGPAAAGSRPDRHPADPSAYGPYPGAGLLRAALSSGRRGAHLGPGQRHDVARGAAVPLPVAAALSGASARPAEHHLPRGAAAAVRDRPVPDPDRAGLSPEPHRRLPHRGAGRHPRLPA